MLKALLQNTLLKGGYLSETLRNDAFGDYALAYGKLLDDNALSPMDLHRNSINTVTKSMGRVLGQSNLPKALYRSSTGGYYSQPETQPVFSTSWRSQMEDIEKQKGISISDVLASQPSAARHGRKV